MKSVLGYLAFVLGTPHIYTEFWGLQQVKIARSKPRPIDRMPAMRLMRSQSSGAILSIANGEDEGAVSKLLP